MVCLWLTQFYSERQHVHIPGGGVGEGTPGFKWQGGMIEGFFWVGKFWKVFFRWLDLRRDIFGYSKQSEDFVIVPTYSWHIVLQIHFYGFINSAWDFLGVKFWSRDFFRFFWVLIFAPIQSSMSLDIQGIPPPPPWGGQIIN